LFGKEEAEHIEPAIVAARAEGLDVEGPIPPDTFYPMVVGGAFDIAIAMYHDQGHIPVKMLGFQYQAESGGWTAVKGINVTLGLPFLRVSVDHGTAFDQAGQGTASPQSLIMALDYATRMA
jgi:4-hydroxythreonine-4-phosphate dehydrogenase